MMIMWLFETFNCRNIAFLDHDIMLKKKTNKQKNNTNLPAKSDKLCKIQG